MRDQIIKIIKEFNTKQKLEINISNENLDKPFKELGVDSINVLQLIVTIEEELHCRLADNVLSEIKTINQLISAFEKLKS